MTDPYFYSGYEKLIRALSILMIKLRNVLICESMIQSHFLQNRKAFMIIKTEAKVDTGGWLYNPRIRVAVLEKTVVFYAPGRRPFYEEVKFSDLSDSVYSHVTGSVFLAPAENLHIKVLPISPLIARDFLRLIDVKDGV